MLKHSKFFAALVPLAVAGLNHWTGGLAGEGAVLLDVAALVTPAFVWAVPNR